MAVHRFIPAAELSPESLAKRRAAKLANYYRHHDAKKAQARQWRSDNPERVREAEKSRGAKRRARVAGVRVEDVDRQVVWERDGGICHLCGKPVEGRWHMDHVVPLALGGAHSYENVAVSHPYCNMSKGIRTRRAASPEAS